jgi:hypothetical protein
MNTRTDFEAWYLLQRWSGVSGGCIGNMPINEKNGEYMNAQQEIAWRAWRAHGATELSRLRGERLVLLELLSEAADVIHNLPDEVETQEEADRINALKDRIADARGAVLLELGPPVK